VPRSSIRNGRAGDTGPFLSPSTRRFDLTEKRALYAANAVAHLWLVDPDARTLEAFALSAGAWTIAAAFQEGDEVRAAPFEALGSPLGTLWPD
jgi:Uma2 family endonuclease